MKPSSSIDAALVKLPGGLALRYTPHRLFERTSRDVDEVADRIYRQSTFVPDIGPTGFTFNQFLIDADDPAVFHTRPRAKFPVVSEAVVSPLERLRWTMFGHLEADECGAMDLFLAAVPKAQVAHTAIGCMVSINDLADRTREPIPDDSTIDLGGRRIRSIATPARS